MGKNWSDEKVEELRQALHERDFEYAMSIADTLDLKKIKDNNILTLAANAYEAGHRYKDAKKALLLAYNNTDAGRNLAYRLCMVSIKEKNFREANEYYKDFVEMAPRDNGRYILKYRMAQAKNEPISKRIKILEEYTNLDMEEKWVYELARLYHEAGDEEKCAAMCDEIDLWFSDGKYAKKASELKQSCGSYDHLQEKQTTDKRYDKDYKKESVSYVNEEGYIGEDYKGRQFFRETSNDANELKKSIKNNSRYNYQNDKKEEAVPEVKDVPHEMEEVLLPKSEPETSAKAESKKDKLIDSAGFKEYEHDYKAQTKEKENESFLETKAEKSDNYFDLEKDAFWGDFDLKREIDSHKLQGEQSNYTEFEEKFESDEKLEKGLFEDEKSGKDLYENEKLEKDLFEDEKLQEDPWQIKGQEEFEKGEEIKKDTGEDGKLENEFGDTVDLKNIFKEDSYDVPESDEGSNLLDAIEDMADIADVPDITENGDTSDMDELSGVFLPLELDMGEIKDIDDVENILTQLKERGILKEDTVQKAVKILDDAAEGLESNAASDVLDEEQSSFEKNLQTPPKAQKEVYVKEETPQDIKADDTDADDAIKQRTVGTEIGYDDSEVEEDYKIASEYEEQHPENSEGIQLSFMDDGEGDMTKETVRIPDISEILSESMEDSKPEKVPDLEEEKSEDAPVFDLSFEAEEKYNDIENQDRNLSDVSQNLNPEETGKIPSRKEIEAALAQAKRAINLNGESKTIQEHSENSKMRVSSNHSAKIEVISGTNWNQSDQKEEEKEEDKKEEVFTGAANSVNITENVAKKEDIKDDVLKSARRPEKVKEAKDRTNEEEKKSKIEEKEENQDSKKNKEKKHKEKVEKKEEAVKEQNAREKENAALKEQKVEEKKKTALKEQKTAENKEAEQGQKTAEKKEPAVKVEKTSRKEELAAKKQDAEEKKEPDVKEQKIAEKEEIEKEEISDEKQEIDRKEENSKSAENNKKEENLEEAENNKNLKGKKQRNKDNKVKEKLNEENFIDLKNDDEKKSKLELTDEDMSRFDSYLDVEGVKENIRAVLNDIIKDYVPDGMSIRDNIVIMGNEKTGKTHMAIEMIKLANEKRKRAGRRVAKIDAAALNRRGFCDSLTQLIGSDMIVENAQNLNNETVDDILEGCEMFTDNMLIVLEGDKKGMQTLLTNLPEMETVFEHKIVVQEYEIGKWVEYGTSYAKALGYDMDELARLALYKAIDDSFGKNKSMEMNDVENIIDRAVSKSGRIGRRIGGIFSSKKNEDGNVILVESDFDI